MAKRIKISKLEEKILSQVPPDYYQKGIKNNYLQRIWHNNKLKTVFDLIEKNPKNVLDVGCASGWFLSEIYKIYSSSKCTGVDIYDKAIEYGKKRYPQINFITTDAHSLPFGSSAFDLVICTEVLEHVDGPDLVLQEIYRVLKKDGKAIVEMDTGNLLFQAIWYWWTNLRQGVWRDSHIHRFNTEKLERVIKNSGFKIKKKKIFNYTMAVAFLLEK